MKWILVAFFCITYVSCEEAIKDDSVVSLVLGQTDDHSSANIQRSKRHEDALEVETRGSWRKRNHHHGGRNQPQNYPGGGPIATGSQSSANSQSSAWGKGGGSGSQSSSNAQSNSFGHGGSSGSSANANSGSWSSGAGGGSLSNSGASSSAQGQGAHGGSLSGAQAQSSATGQGGFFYPGTYQGKK